MYFRHAQYISRPTLAMQIHKRTSTLRITESGGNAAPYFGSGRHYEAILALPAVTSFIQQKVDLRHLSLVGSLAEHGADRWRHGLSANPLFVWFFGVAISVSRFEAAQATDRRGSALRHHLQ